MSVKRGMYFIGLLPSGSKLFSSQRDAVKRREPTDFFPAAASLAAETRAVLGRVDEGFDHLGTLVVAAELFEFRKPEVIARPVGVAPLVRVAPQVAEVLHQDEGRVELLPAEALVLGDGAEHLRARHAPLVERDDERVGDARVGTDARVQVEALDELRVAQLSKLGGERLTRRPLVEEGARVVGEDALPPFCVDDNVAREPPRVGEKLVALRQAAVGGAVEFVDEEARALKLDGEEEGRRDVDALALKTGRVARAARSHVDSPEVKAAFVRVAPEKVSVVLPDEEGRVVQGMNGGV